MIIVRLQGGMGNQMFQYALGRALSVKYNVPLGLDLSFLLDRTRRPRWHKFTFRDYYLDVFNMKAEIVSQSQIPFLYRRYFGGILMIGINGLLNMFNKIFHKKRFFSFDSFILNKGPNTYLNGNWQSYKYFQNIEDVIQKDFTLKDELPENIKNLMKEIEENNSLCIHIRRGDYVGNSYYEIVGEEYYNKAIEKIKNLGKIDKIYVFSDDIRWCEENLKFEFPTMFVGGGYVGRKNEGHLILMSFCKYFIIPNSTFSWWGAYLSKREGKIVITPSKWDKNNYSNIDDIIKKEWIKI